MDIKVLGGKSKWFICVWFDLEQVCTREQGYGLDLIDLEVLWRLMKIRVWSIYDCSVRYVVMIMVWYKYSDACRDLGLMDVENCSEELI